jgi:hypothetical protein
MQYRFRYIQKRLAHASIIHNDRPTGAVPRAIPPPPPPPRVRAPNTLEALANLLARGHALHKVRHRRTTIYRCGLCSGSCAQSRLNTWHTDCPGHTLPRSQRARTTPPTNNPAAGSSVPPLLSPPQITPVTAASDSDTSQAAKRARSMTNTSPACPDPDNHTPPRPCVSLLYAGGKGARSSCSHRGHGRNSVSSSAKSP